MTGGQVLSLTPAGTPTPVGDAARHSGATVASEVGCDFATTIGHQCHTLVNGPGGDRLGDYRRLGWPLSLLAIVVGALVARMRPVLGS